MSAEFELIDSEVQWRGRIISAGVERFRYVDGESFKRDKVWHPGAVGVIATDEQAVWLTRQPREAARLTDSLEIPAGKLDVEGESPLECAKRELAEEVGLRAELWEPVLDFHTSLGFCDERIWLFAATGLSPAPGGAMPDHDERIQIVRWPVDRIDSAIGESTDSKTLIALLWLLTTRSGTRR